MALIQCRDAHVVVRKNQLRATDFCTGQRLGKEDYLVCWKKLQRPKWMSAEEYAKLPSSLTLREVRVRVTQEGFRTPWDQRSFCPRQPCFFHCSPAWSYHRGWCGWKSAWHFSVSREHDESAIWQMQFTPEELAQLRTLLDQKER